MCSFLACPNDTSVIFWFSISVVIFLYVFYLKYKNRELLFVLFSILFNLIFFLVSISGSLIFRIYRIEWFQYFSVFIWPVINIILIIKYFKKHENH